MKRIPGLFAAVLLLELAAAAVLLNALIRIAPKPPKPAAPAIIAPPPGPARPSAALILCYHAVTRKPVSPYEVSVRDFTAQMDWLAGHGYKVVALSTLVGYLAAKQTLPDSLVAITFDDGYESVYANAWPILKQRSFPFSIFIYPGFIGKGRGSLSWKQVRELAAAGVEVGSHSMTHPVLTRKDGRSEKAYRQWLTRELEGSKDTIESRIGMPVRYLAYPYAAFDRSVEDAAKAAGYESCLLVNAGVNDTATSPFHVDRVIVSRHFTLPLFKAIFEKRSLELAEVKPYQGEEVIASRNLDISARIRRLAEFDRVSIAMKVSRSRGTAVIDTVTGLARFMLDKPLKKGFHEAALYARNKCGQRCVGCWMFLVRE
ncbi:MAG: polysaccharide deacetylase family protein [Candidatus Edwardsbacteria bacterium]|nr:polysaccharide deacetylase family protein [Candidatus Edwardsbacteria bacterium]